MNSLVLIILLVFLINELKCSYDDKIYFLTNFTENYTLNKSSLHYNFNNVKHNFSYKLNDNLYDDKIKIKTKPEKILFGNIKFLKNGTMLRNIPREDDTIKDTFIKYADYKSKDFESWPNFDFNNFTENNISCEGFISIIAFELDDEENIYILDEGNSNCPIMLYKFNSKGKNLENYTIYNNNSLNMLLTDLAIDIINDYAYISYSYISNKEIEIGFLSKNLDNPKEETKQIKISDNKLKYDEQYNIKNDFIDKNFPNVKKKLISITLSCDGDVLFFCPLLSRMIYSISTDKLRESKKESIFKNDVNEGYKNDASPAMISSNLGNLYLSALEKNVIYFAGQIDNDFSIFDYRAIDEIMGVPNMEWPMKMSITDGMLYIICKNIITNEKDANNFTLITTIYQASIDKEKSYIYKCAGLIYVWNNMSYFIWILFILIVCFALVFVFIGNQEDKDINKKND